MDYGCQSKRDTRRTKSLSNAPSCKWQIHQSAYVINVFFIYGSRELSRLQRAPVSPVRAVIFYVFTSCLCVRVKKLVSSVAVYEFYYGIMYMITSCCIATCQSVFTCIKSGIWSHLANHTTMERKVAA